MVCLTVLTQNWRVRQKNGRPGRHLATATVHIASLCSLTIRYDMIWYDR